MAGGVKASNETYGDPAERHDLHGDEGNDHIWGENGTSYQYIWGGEGSDKLYGGTDTVVQQIIYGNSGDDIIHPYGGHLDIRASGGKGNDTINPVTKVDDGTGMGSYTFTNNAEGNGTNAGVGEKFYGGDGDDTIWGGWEPLNQPVLYKGGAGNDKLYGAYNLTGMETEDTQTIVGGADKDLINLNFYKDINAGEDENVGSTNHWIFGDYGYGPYGD